MFRLAIILASCLTEVATKIVLSVLVSARDALTYAVLLQRKSAKAEIRYCENVVLEQCASDDVVQRSSNLQTFSNLLNTSSAESALQTPSASFAFVVFQTF